MGFPKVTQGRVDQNLSNVLMAYTNEGKFIVDKVLPVVPGLKDDTGDIPVMGDAHFRLYNTKRALYDRARHEAFYSIDASKKYEIGYYDIETYIPDRLRSQFKAPFNPERDATFFLGELLMLEREAALSAAMTDTNVVTQNVTLSGTSKWNNQNSDPLGDLETARDAIFNGTGEEATHMAITRQVLNSLKRHPQILAQFKGISTVSRKQVMEYLMDYLELKEILVAKARYNSAREGQAPVMTNLWGANVVLFHRPDSPSIMKPSFGYSFQLQGENRRISTRRDLVGDKGDFVRADYAYDDRILDAKAAYLIKNAN